MSTAVEQAPSVAAASEAPATPYEQISVTLTKQEHVELVLEAHNWRSRHQRAIARIEQQRLQYDQALERIKALEKLMHVYERVRLREAELREQLVYSLEQIRLREATLRKQHACELKQAQQQQAALREQLAQEQAYSRVAATSAFRSAYREVARFAQGQCAITAA